MSLPPPPAYAAAPRRSTADLVVTIVCLTVAWVALATWGLLGLFMLAFTDYCPPESCSIDGASVSVLGSIGAAGLVALIGSIVGGVLLARRRTGWVVALVALVLVLGLAGAGFVGYLAAVDH